MGRLEKIVVFTVLFLVAVILGVSLSTDPATGSPNELLAEGRGANAGGPNAGKTPAERRAAREAAQRSAPEGLMSTSLADRSANNAAPAGSIAADPREAPPVAADPAAAGAGKPVAPSNGAAPTSPAVANAPVTSTVQAPAPSASYLVSREGLEPTASDEFMVYTWKAGDTFAALAQRFYGSPLHVKRIRDANEGRDEAKLAAGESLLICALPTADSDRIARPSARDAKPSAAVAVVGGTYTVGAGDVLGTISQKVYGSASKWRKIYDANRDVIGSDPNQLKPGMMLRIPQ